MRALIAVMALLAATAAQAVEPDEMLDNPEQEERAQAIDTQLRCVVCQSQSIADSNAPLAKDLRLLVRERVSAGDSDSEVIAYVVDRYGDYVLLKPRFKSNTVLLWLFPAIAFAIGAAGLAFYFRTRPKPASQTPLSPEEEEAINRIIDERR